MFESSPLNPEKREEILSAEELREALGEMGALLVFGHRAKKIGNTIYADNVCFTIAESGDEDERVTHAKLSRRQIGEHVLPTTHEIYFPTSDSDINEPSVAGAVFVRHEYSSAGERTGTYAHTVANIKLQSDKQIQAFMREFEEAYNLARADF